jgi:hypothetical protein
MTRRASVSLFLLLLTRACGPRSEERLIGPTMEENAEQKAAPIAGQRSPAELPHLTELQSKALG